MAQAPIEIQSKKIPSTPPHAGKAVSLVKEKAKQDLFKAIDDQNIEHGGRQKNIETWYDEKVKKFEKRGMDTQKAQTAATKQIQKVWSKTFTEKIATPGTKSGDTYKDIGDTDGEGAIFLLKKFLFDKRYSSTTYLSHEDIETNAQTSDLSDEKALKMFLDGGGVPGVTVSSDEGKGLRSAWKKSRIVVDHHPLGATSSAGMVAKLLDILHIIPAKEKKAVEKFVQTIDIVDSFLSKAGRGVDVENDYAKTLVALSYQLDSEELFALCEKLPDGVGPLSPIPDEILENTLVKIKWKKDKIKLIECTQKKQKEVNTGVAMVLEKIKQKQFVTIEGKKMLVFGPKDNINNDVRAVLSAEHDYGTIKIHENGDIFMVHDNGVPAVCKELGLTIRDIIFLLNPTTAKHAYDTDAKAFCDAFADDEGRKYLFSLLATGTVKTEAQPITEEMILEETTEVRTEEKTTQTPEKPTEKTTTLEKTKTIVTEKKPTETPAPIIPSRPTPVTPRSSNRPGYIASVTSLRKSFGTWIRGKK